MRRTARHQARCPSAATGPALATAVHGGPALLMRKARSWLRHLPLAAICASFSPALRAAEAPRPATAGPLARTVPPGCAKLVCQRRRAVAVVDSGGQSSAGAAQGSSPVSVRLGL